MKDSMSFTVSQKPGSVALPDAAFSLCGFEGDTEFELHTGRSVLAVLKKKMTALDMVSAIGSLYTLADSLSEYLVKVCGDCGQCDCCVYDAQDDEELCISDARLLSAGISPEAKLKVTADRENNRVIITAAGYAHDLSDVPEEVLELFEASGAARCDLDQHLRKGDIIYGNE